MMAINEKPLLYDFWKRSRIDNSAKINDTDLEVGWDQDIKVLYELGIGMEETLQFLYFNNPSYDEFLHWLNKIKNTSAIVEINEASKNENDVLTKEDLIFWKENGYLVLRNVISQQECVAAQNAIWEFLNMKADDPSTWYKNHDEKKGLMVSFVHHPTLDANRESPIIRKAYEQLYKSTEIYKTIDKVSFNPPETMQSHFMGSKLHWDVSLELPIPFCLQGLLYLTDCESHEGAFHCVPGFHNHIDNWLSNLSTDINPREEALRTLKSVPVTGQAGDFIIWHQALPHCATPNLGKTPRMVQYLTYLPKQKEIQKIWK